MGAAAIVVGNPKAGSRTLTVARSVMAHVSECLAREGEVAPEVVDLADHASELFDWESASLNACAERVASCDLLVAASPTYKATYTGLLKGFFDRYQSNGLAGVVVVPVMVGAAPMHALAPEVHLRPLFVELGATVPSRALYVMESQLDQLDEVVERWAVTARPLLQAALAARKPVVRP